MAARMLIDANHPEETRVVILKGNRIDEFDFESSTKKTIKGNIYLAKVTRVEPSLQAAFVEYGGNRHGFLAFSEIHPDYYQIPVADRQALLDAQAAEDAAAEAEEEAADAQAEAEAGNRPRLEGGDADGEPVAETSDSLYPVDSTTDDQPDHDAHGHDDDPPAEATPPSIAENTGLEMPVMAGAVESDAELNAQPSETSENGEAHEGEAQPSAIEEMPRTETDVATVGGDVLDEVRQPRRRVPVRHYKIQEVIKRRQILLVQVVKEERGNKGAALTTFLSLAGRYCVLMPNTARGGGISRKIVSAADRRRLKSIAQELDPPEGMGVIVRTAGMERSRAEIKRDYDFLLRSWDQIRETTLQSTAPALVYEEGTLIKRAIRDLYHKDIEEVWVEGEDGYRQAKDLMKVLMPSHAKRVQPYRDPVPLFHRFQVETQLDAMYTPVVQLRSGGYIVINTTEALVAIDVNSGRATREHNIEETAYKTNMEAAEEVARQLRLRDLAGLIVIDFIDMENHRNTRNVERKLKECLKGDRARIQVGRISAFGLMEMSRQRLRPSLIEASTQVCPHCTGLGHVRSTESAALHVLRAVEDEGIRDRTDEMVLSVANPVAIYLFNHKRSQVAAVETRYQMKVMIAVDDTLVPPNHRIDRVKTRTADPARLEALKEWRVAPVEEDGVIEGEDEDDFDVADEPIDNIESIDGPSDRDDHDAQGEDRDAPSGEGKTEDGRRRRRRRRRRGDRPEGAAPERVAADGERSAEEAVAPRQTPANALDFYGEDEDSAEDGNVREPEGDDTSDTAEAGAAPRTGGEGRTGEDGARPRRRGRRGGRRRNRDDREPLPPRPARVADPTEAEQPTVSIWPGISEPAPSIASPPPSMSTYEPPAPEAYVAPAPAPVSAPEPVFAKPVESEPATTLLPGQTEPGEAEIVVMSDAEDQATEKKPRFGWWRRK